MEVLLVRHAIAHPALAGQRDADRALTPEGVRRFQEVVAGLGRLGLELGAVRCSPFLRAVQTAELLAPLWSPGSGRGAPAPEPDPGLATAPAAAWLETWPQGPGKGTGEPARLALVGHEPWMSQLAGLLVAGDSRGLGFAFKKGGVAWLEGVPTPGGMTLRGFLPPRITRALR